MEMVMAISIVVVVTGAVLPLLASIRRSWDAGRHRTEMVQHARVLMDHLYRHLATASAITDVSLSTDDAGHIEFVADDGKRYRYVLGDDGYVEFGPPDDSADLAGPLARLRFVCYDSDDFAVPTTRADDIRLVTLEATFSDPAGGGRDKTFASSVYLRSGPTGALLDPGIAAKDGMVWLLSDIDSYRSSEGEYRRLAAGAEAIATVNATERNSLVLLFAALRGDAYCGPGGDPRRVISTGFGEITGEKLTLAEPIDIPEIPSPPEGSYLGDLARSSGTLVVSDDSHYGAVLLSSRATLRISGNVTMVLDDRLEVRDSAQIVIAPNSSLRLYVKGPVSPTRDDAVTVRDSAELNGSVDSSQDPSQLQIYIVGDNHTMTIRDQATVCAVVQNPAGRVVLEGTLWGLTEFFGKIRARRVDGVLGRVHVDLDSDFDRVGD